MIRETLTISTSEGDEIRDITDEVASVCAQATGQDGVCQLFLHHTSAALSLADLDPGTKHDLKSAFRAMVPDLDYKHQHDPSHVPDHILSTLIGVSVSIPITDGELQLGTWQRIVLCEFNGPRERNVTVTIISD